MIGLDAILLIKSNVHGSPRRAELCLSDQGWEQDVFPDVVTVVRVRAIDPGRECPFHRVARVYAEEFEQFL